VGVKPSRLHDALMGDGESPVFEHEIPEEGREILKRMIAELPPETRRITLMLLEEIERLGERIEEIEGRMREVFFLAGGGAPSEHPWGWVHSGWL